jgi:hypothetical protein
MVFVQEDCPKKERTDFEILCLEKRSKEGIVQKTIEEARTGMRRMIDCIKAQEPTESLMTGQIRTC